MEKTTSKQIAELNKEIEKLRESYELTLKNKEATEFSKGDIEQLSTLEQTLSSFKDTIGTMLIKAGRKIHSQTEEEKELESFIDNVEIELTEEDFDPVAITDYLASSRIMPTISSLSEAESNLYLSEKLKYNESISKFALIHKAHIALLLNKNLKNQSFTENFLKANNLHYSETSFIKLLDKYQEYKKQEKQNIKLLCEICEINYEHINFVSQEDLTHRIKIAKKAYPEHYDFTIAELDCVAEPKTADEVFIQYANAYLSFGLPDPERKLSERVDELTSKLFTKESHLTSQESSCEFIENSNKTVSQQLKQQG